MENYLKRKVRNDGHKTEDSSSAGGRQSTIRKDKGRLLALVIL